MVGEAWFTFGVGMTFLIYPLSPLQAIWPSLIHYLWATLWALLSLLCCLNSMQRKRQLKWTVLAAVTYLASLLSHEGTALIPLAFVCSHLVFGTWQRGRVLKHPLPESSRRPAVTLLTLLLLTLAMYGVWRKMILPLYGLEDYESSEVGFSLGIFFSKVFDATRTIFFPWVDAFRQVLDWRPEPKYVVLSVVLSIVSAVVTFRLAKQPAAGQAPVPGSAQTINASQWLWTASVGFSLIAAALVIFGISPLLPGTILGGDMFSRLYFAAVIGVAFAVPASYLLAVLLYERAPKFVSLSILCCLLAFGFIFFPLSGNILTHKSEFPQVFGRYSLIHAAGLIVYVFGVVLLGLLSFVSAPRRTRSFGFAGMIGVLVLLGSLYHFSVKHQYAARWRQQVTMFGELRQIAPSLKDDTFVVINDPQDYLPLSHHELSGYLVVLYNNWTIMGNREQHVRFYADGVESSHYNQPVRWRPPEIVGPLTETFIRGKSEPLDRIQYDRLLSFDFDGAHLRLRQSIDVITKEGQHLTLENHPNRILPGPPVKAAVWRHLSSSIALTETGLSLTQ
jgi:hypothetical protein